MSERIEADRRGVVKYRLHTEVGAVVDLEVVRELEPLTYPMIRHLANKHAEEVFRSPVVRVEKLTRDGWQDWRWMVPDPTPAIITAAYSPDIFAKPEVWP